MGGNNSKGTKIDAMIHEFEVIQQIKSDNLTYLEHKHTKEQYILRQFSFNDRHQCDRVLKHLSELKNKLAGNRHVVMLKDYATSQEDQYCSTFYKIYALFEYPQRTLDDEINERNLQKRKFTETQLWSILASCILGMSHLQRNHIKHSSLRSDAILLSPDGIIKISDPFATGQLSNYQRAYQKRSTPHLYLPPQQAVALQQSLINPSFPTQKGDIWTIGMIMLEAGLLDYKDECYRDEWSRVHWESIYYNLNCFGQQYSSELKGMLEMMLSRDDRSRPDWIQLEQYVIKNQQAKKGNTLESTPIHDPQNQLPFTQKQIISKSQFSGYSPKIQFNNSSRAVTSPHQKLIKQPNLRLPGSTLTFGSNQFTSLRKYNPVHQPQQMEPIKQSDISRTRPLKSYFPSNYYPQRSKPDENLVLIEQARQSKDNPHTIKVNTALQYVVEEFKAGSRYEGYKLNGKRHGHGKFYYQDGGMYDGEWNQNKMTGYGKLFYQSGRIAYEGYWENDKFDGKGTLYNQSFESLEDSFDYRNFDEINEYWIKYEGLFKEDMKTGKGILYLSNGERYEGEFESDSVHGEGMFMKRKGERVRGRWNSNHMLR